MMSICQGAMSEIMARRRVWDDVGPCSGRFLPQRRRQPALLSLATRLPIAATSLLAFAFLRRITRLRTGILPLVLLETPDPKAGSSIVNSCATGCAGREPQVEVPDRGGLHRPYQGPLR